MCRICNLPFRACRCTSEQIIAASDNPIDAFSVQVDSGKSMAQIEREIILGVLRRNNWNRTHTADQLRISIRTVRNKINMYRRTGHVTREQ